MSSNTRPLAIVTGASSGIGYELAKLCAENGYDLLVAADRPLGEAVETFRGLGAQVDSVEADLATLEGVDRLCEAIGGRPVEALLANAGHGLGRAFLDQDFDEIRQDRKSTRLNSSHANISYAVFCLKKKTHYSITDTGRQSCPCSMFSAIPDRPR